MIHLSPHIFRVGFSCYCQHSTGGIYNMKDNSIKQQLLADQGNIYYSFQEQLLTGLKKFFPDDTRLSIDSFSHNNQLSLDGLTILEPGSNISPTIYLEQYFRQYQEGAALSDIQQQILAFYRQHRITQNVDTSFFTCLDNVQPQIVYKLINFRKNRELLGDLPHFAYLDLAIVFYCLVPNDCGENASILIHNSHLDYWGISKDSLLLFAQKNTPKLLPWRFDSLMDLLLPMLSSLSGEEEQKLLQSSENEHVPMYVLTNNRCYFGACCILYPDVLKKISETLEDNLFLLPSSIHEVIIIPASFADNPNDLHKIVCEVNLTEVATEEILSDSIYYYDRDTDQISMQ